ACPGIPSPLAISIGSTVKPCVAIGRNIEPSGDAEQLSRRAADRAGRDERDRGERRERRDREHAETAVDRVARARDHAERIVRHLFLEEAELARLREQRFAQNGELSFLGEAQRTGRSYGKRGVGLLEISKSQLAYLREEAACVGLDRQSLEQIQSSPRLHGAVSQRKNPLLRRV